MDYVYAFVQLLSGLGAFLIGFKILSENIEKLANSGLKKLFNKTSKNRFIGVLIGLVVTAIIQSSGTTTVMIVGFVNAGLMNLFQATAMIMGANIGTTITAQIVALNSFNIAKFLIVFCFIGIFGSMIVKSEKSKTIFLCLAGLGLVFLSLDLMVSSMNGFKDSETIRNLLSSISNPFVLFLIGIVFTALLQSSSALTTIIISMVTANLVIGNGGNSVLYIILGSNIGSCVTALLSSFGASTNAKRASFIHFLFNFTGSLIFIILLLCIPSFMDNTFAKWFSQPGTQIAMFHTFFNVACTLIFLPFVNAFVKISEFVIKDKKEEKTTSLLDERFLKTPTIAINQAIKETINLGNDAMKVLNETINDFMSKTYSNAETYKKIISSIDKKNDEITSYLLKVTATSDNLTDEDELNIAKLHKVLIDYTREAEIADNVIKYTKTTLDKDLEFSEIAFDGIKNIQDKLNEQFVLTKNMFDFTSNDLLKASDLIENKIDNIRKETIDSHLKRLEEGKCSPSSNTVFISLISNLERAGDHLNYIAHTINNE